MSNTDQPDAMNDLEVARAMTTMTDRSGAPPGMLDRLRYVAAIVRDLPPDSALPALAFRTKPDGPVQVIPLTGSNDIGRLLPKFIKDTHLSRRHFRVVEQGGQWLLEDLKSHNGTYVNGRRCAEHVLRDGDIIEAGKRVLVFLPGKDQGRA